MLSTASLILALASVSLAQQGDRDGTLAPRPDGTFAPREGTFAPREGTLVPRPDGTWVPRPDGTAPPRDGTAPPRPDGTRPDGPRPDGTAPPRPDGTRPDGPRPDGTAPPRDGTAPPRDGTRPPFATRPVVIIDRTRAPGEPTRAPVSFDRPDNAGGLSEALAKLRACLAAAGDDKSKAEACQKALADARAAFVESTRKEAAERETENRNDKERITDVAKQLKDAETSLGERFVQACENAITRRDGAADAECAAKCAAPADGTTAEAARTLLKAAIECAQTQQAALVKDAAAAGKGRGAEGEQERLKAQDDLKAIILAKVATLPEQAQIAVKAALDKFAAAEGERAARAVAVAETVEKIKDAKATLADKDADDAAKAAATKVLEAAKADKDKAALAKKLANKRSEVAQKKLEEIKAKLAERRAAAAAADDDDDEPRVVKVDAEVDEAKADAFIAKIVAKLGATAARSAELEKPAEKPAEKKKRQSTKVTIEVFAGTTGNDQALMQVELSDTVTAEGATVKNVDVFDQTDVDAAKPVEIPAPKPVVVDPKVNNGAAGLSLAAVAVVVSLAQFFL
jgi:hypothetical protein